MDKLLNRKNSIALLIPAIVGNAAMLVLNIKENGGLGVDLPIIILSLVYLSMLKQIDEPKKFQCIPAFLLFYITAARIVCCLKDFSNTAGIIVMIPIVIGCVYIIIPTVKMWYEYYK